MTQRCGQAHHQQVACAYSIVVQYSAPVTPEERAKAVVEHFTASLPPAVRPELEKVIARAIKRALQQQLAELEQIANSSAEYAMGRGKDGKGRDENAVRCHDQWANRFSRMRTALTQNDA
jgi:hypothetical protein